MIVNLFCHSCSVTRYQEQGKDDTFFGVKAKLREQLGQDCPRRHGSQRCPMRESNVVLPFPSVADVEVA